MGNRGDLKLLESVHLVPTSPEQKSVGIPYVPPGEPEPEKEVAIRKLFADLKIAPDRDEVHDYNGYANHMRDLEYSLGNEAIRATVIVERLLREVYEVREEDALHFTLEV
jgi:hypothetical protein